MTSDTKHWLLIHSFGFPSSQWKRLKPLLQGTVFTPNLPGYPGTPWDPAKEVLDADSDSILELAKKHPGAHLVGHSYGGLVALHAAKKRPDLFSEVSLIEPIVIGLVERPEDLDPAMMRAIESLKGAIEHAHLESALRAFFDFWGGPNAFDSMPAPIRNSMLAMAPKLAQEIQATGAESSKPDDWKDLPPLRIIVSKGRKPFVESIAQGLVSAVSGSRIIEVPGEHMCPITHPKDVAAALIA
jgi:pimeloyl-ACP methyl ester carboxylesterase